MAALSRVLVPSVGYTGASAISFSARTGNKKSSALRLFSNGSSSCARRSNLCVRASVEPNPSDSVGSTPIKPLDQTLRETSPISSTPTEPLQTGPESAAGVGKNGNVKGPSETLSSTPTKPLSEVLAEKAPTEGSDEESGDLRTKAGAAVGQLKEKADAAENDVADEAGKARGSLSEQSDKAASVLFSTAHDAAESSKERLGSATKAAPGPVKQLAQTAVDAHSEEKAKSGAVIHDFCLGIPYGAFLAIGGIVWFVLTASESALLYGTLLGSVILAASIASLRAWQNKKPYMQYIAVQVVGAAIVLFKEASRYAKSKAIFPTAITAFVSLAMVVFYAYVVLAGGNPPSKKDKQAAQAS